MPRQEPINKGDLVKINPNISTYQCGAPADGYSAFLFDEAKERQLFGLVIGRNKVTIKVLWFGIKWANKNPTHKTGAYFCTFEDHIFKRI